MSIFIVAFSFVVSCFLAMLVPPRLLLLCFGMHNWSRYSLSPCAFSRPGLSRCLGCHVPFVFGVVSGLCVWLFVVFPLLLAVRVSMCSWESCSPDIIYFLALFRSAIHPLLVFRMARLFPDVLLLSFGASLSLVVHLHAAVLGVSGCGYRRFLYLFPVFLFPRFSLSLVWRICGYYCHWWVFFATVVWFARFGDSFGVFGLCVVLCLRVWVWILLLLDVQGLRWPILLRLLCIRPVYSFGYMLYAFPVFLQCVFFLRIICVVRNLAWNAANLSRFSDSMLNCRPPDRMLRTCLRSLFIFSSHRVVLCFCTASVFVMSRDLERLRRLRCCLSLFCFFFVLRVSMVSFFSGVF